MSDYPYTPPSSSPAAAAEPQAEVVEHQADVVDVAVGDLVTVTYLDGSTGVDVVRMGLVVERVEGDPCPAVAVAYLPEPTAPIPLDPSVHGRDDAPRVARVEV